MNKIIAISLLLLANNIFAATTSVAVPTITKSVSIGTTFKFTETLSGTLPAGYKVKIDLNNGKGLVTMNCSGKNCSLSSNVLPKNVDSATYSVGIYDSKGVLQNSSTNGAYVISSTAATSTFPYTKISNSGAVLPDTAALGGGANDWACTKDNKTGLVWEVKTDDGGLRDRIQTYSDYFANDTGYDASDNANVFVNTVNKQKMCGASDWRLPTKEELMTLVFCSDGKYDSDGSCKNTSDFSSAINSTYFPNTQGEYWSSSPYAGNTKNAWYVSSYDGTSGYDNKRLKASVRLVR